MLRNSVMNGVMDPSSYLLPRFSYLFRMAPPSQTGAQAKQFACLSVCDPIAWLSELYKERQYIKSNIVALNGLISHA